MNILVSRPKKFIDKTRAYKLYVDDVFIMDIRDGEELNIVLPLNSEKICAKIDWCSSNELDLTELKNNDKLKIHNTHSKNILIPFYILFIIFFRRNNYLKIEKI